MLLIVILLGVCPFYHSADQLHKFVNKGKEEKNQQQTTSCGRSLAKPKKLLRVKTPRNISYLSQEEQFKRRCTPNYGQASANRTIHGIIGFEVIEKE